MTKYIAATILIAGILLGAGLAFGLSQNVFAGDSGEKKHEKSNCDITTFLSPSGDLVVSITGILQANNNIAINDTLIENATQEISQNDTVTNEIVNAINDSDAPSGDNVTAQVIEVLVNQTVIQDVAQEIVSEAIVDVVQSGEQVTEESVNASATEILNDNETVSEIANITIDNLNGTEIADQAGTAVIEDPEILDNVISIATEPATTVEVNVTEQATKIIHMKTTGIPEGNFKLIDPANNNTVVQDLSVKVSGGIPAGDYLVTIAPANAETAQAVIESTPDTSGNITGTLEAQNQTDNELPPQNATNSTDQID